MRFGTMWHRTERKGVFRSVNVSFGDEAISRTWAGLIDYPEVLKIINFLSGADRTETRVNIQWNPMTIISTLLMTHPHKGIGMWLPLQSSFFLGLGLAGLILGCGGAPSPEDANSRGSTQRHGWPQSTAGRVAITLVNEGDSAEVASVNLHITGVEVRAAFSPWIDLPLGALAKTAVLMADPLEPLVEAGVLPEGAYQEVKFRLGDQHSFMDRNGVTHALLAPAELVCHRAGLTVKGGSSANLAFLVDAASAIRERPAGSGRFKLEAHALMARNLGQTGSISGSVRLDGTHAPLAGATVTAQALQPGSAPFRGALTARGVPADASVGIPTTWLTTYCGRLMAVRPWARKL